MKTFPVISLFMLAILVGCGGGKGSESEKSIPQKAEESKVEEQRSQSGSLEYKVKRKVELNRDFSNAEEFKSSLNDYSISIRASSGNFVNTYIGCTKSNQVIAPEVYRGSFDKYGSEALVNVSIIQSDPALVEFNCFVLADDNILDRFNFSLQKSFVISGKKSFIQALGTSKIKTLYLDENAILSTSGQNISFEIEELFSNGGKIATFFEDEINSTRDNQDGDSGNKIVIEAAKGFGKISFELRGKNAGAQTRIPPKNKNIPKATPDLNSPCNGRVQEKNTNNCAAKQGHTGFKGHQGFHGRAGGDSGSLDLRIPKLSDFEVNITFLPGKGGEGGKGGAGGDGGPGGKGSKYSIIMHQDRTDVKVPAGKAGAQGPVGDKGPKGFDGEVGRAIIEAYEDNFMEKINTNWSSKDML